MSHPSFQVASPLPDLLDRAIDRLSEDAGMVTHSKRLVQLGERLREDRFHLAVLGQFKRGKSTLLNALLGEAILPEAVLPATALPTFLRHGDRCRVRIEIEDDRAVITGESDTVHALLSRFATESGNPENRLGVSRIEVFHPAPILRGGVVLIDTPGIGSTSLHNTDTTLEFLPQCDAALFVSSIDPPMTQAELDFLREVRSKGVHLFYVVNKIDYLPPEERSEVLRFFERGLHDGQAIDAEVTVFAVSAREGLQARLSNDPALWTRSGVERVQSHLVDFLAKGKKRALERSLAEKGREVVETVLLEERLAIRSLELTGEELEERLRLLETKILEARGQKRRAEDLLAGDERRLERVLQEMAARLTCQARDHFAVVLRTLLERGGSEETPNHQAVEEVVAGAMTSFFEREFGEAARAFERSFSDAIGDHRARLRELAESVRRAAAELFEVPYQAANASSELEVAREPFWITRGWSASLSPVPEGFFDRLWPPGIRRRRLRARFAEKVESLVRQNAENLRWALVQALGDGFRRFRSSLEEGLDDAIAASHGAVARASARREERSGTVSQDLARRRDRLSELEAIARALGAS